MTKIVEIFCTNKDGLHLRPASQLAAEAFCYRGNVILECNGKSLSDLRSVSSILGLGINYDDLVTVKVYAETEDAAEEIEESVRAALQMTRERELEIGFDR